VAIPLSGRVPRRASGPSRSQVDDGGGSRCVSRKLIGYLGFSRRGVFIGEGAASEVGQGADTHRGRCQGLESYFSFIWVLEVITTVMTSPYHFYFIVVPREASNSSEVRFGDVAVLKQIFILYCKNSWKLSEYLLDLQLLMLIPPVISKLSLVEHFLIWATKNTLKNQPLSAVLFWQISDTICVCLSNAFFLSSFDHRTFLGSCYSSICFICGGF
jgi:hypothetical protein